MREKLIEILRVPIYPHELADPAEVVADYLIDNGVTIQKWIPVSERLPKKNGTYLVCTIHDFYRTKNVAKASFRSGGFYGQGGHWSNVTHWMPLPEPPKGVE